MTLTDESIMQFGKHRGKKMVDIPASYLLWLNDEGWVEEKYPEVDEYIQENIEGLEMDVREELSHYESEEEFLNDK